MVHHRRSLTRRYLRRRTTHLARAEGGVSISDWLLVERTADPSASLRDDKKERVVVGRGRLLKEGAVADGFPPNTALSLGNGPLRARTLSFLSSRAKPRDLQFHGIFLEVFK